MSVAKSGIEWTDSTWNPTTGCTKVSAGCDRCYADTMAQTKLRDVYTKRLPVLDSDAARADPFALRLWPERLTQPAKWKDPRMIFVNSMSDLFHVDVPDEYLRQIFDVMLGEDRHIYQVLTKRPARAAKWLRANGWSDENPLPGHIWLGTSVEDESNVYRAAHLLSAPASVHFLSLEPLLGPVNLYGYVSMNDYCFNAAGYTKAIDWVITGGESGIGARPCNPDWVREIRDMCVRTGTAFFHKQWGGRTPKAGGRELDGRTWDEMPQPARGEGE